MITFQNICNLMEQDVMGGPASAGAPAVDPMAQMPGMPGQEMSAQPRPQKQKKHRHRLHHAENENKKIAAIKSGLKVRPKSKKGATFWDDFIKVTGNAEDLAHLLGISKYDIAGWSSKIKKYLSIVQDEMDGEKKKHKMLKTGDSMPSDSTNVPGSKEIVPQGTVEAPNPFMGS